MTVTWMRLLARLHLLTGEVRYLDRIEQSAFNALYGSINEHQNQQARILYREIILRNCSDECLVSFCIFDEPD